MSMIVFLAKLFSPNFAQNAKRSNVMQVLTIAVSHYAELACWSLQLAGIPFKEHAYAPAQHILPVVALRVGDPKNKHLSATSRTTAVDEFGTETDPLISKEKKDKARRKDAAARASAVPVAVCPDGKVLVDSWSIAAYSGLAPIDPEVKKMIDEELGPLARQFAYSRLLQPQNLHFLDQMCTMNTGWLWRFLWYIKAGSYIKGKLIQTFKPYDDQATEDCARRLQDVARRLEKVLEGRSGRYLGGDSPGIADIALASLAAPLINPPLYRGGVYGKVFDAFLEQDAVAKECTQQWRQTPLGKFTLELYQSHRLR